MWRSLDSLWLLLPHSILRCLHNNQHVGVDLQIGLMYLLMRVGDGIVGGIHCWRHSLLAFGMNLGHADTPVKTHLDVRDPEATPDSSPN